MKTIEKSFRHHAFGSPLSEQSIRNYFDPNTHRISTHIYPKATKVPGIMRPATCFFLAGECKYSFQGDELVLRDGDFARLPGGDFDFEVLGDRDLKIVLVWCLPDLMRAKKLPQHCT